MTLNEVTVTILKATETAKKTLKTDGIYISIVTVLSVRCRPRPHNELATVQFLLISGV